MVYVPIMTSNHSQTNKIAGNESDIFNTENDLDEFGSKTTNFI